MTHNSATCLNIKDLSVYYQQQPILSDVSLALPEGQKIAIIGANGAGKSTLLRSILGLVPTASGDVSFWQAPFTTKRRSIAYVPQRTEIDWDFPIQVLDVVLMGRQGHLRWWQRPTATDREIARDALEQVGMQAYGERQIAQLSGGQQQRVFIARALAQQARLMILDEPFAGVDMKTEQALVNLFDQQIAQGNSLISVHHDLTTLKNYFDWVVMINGRVIASGPVASILTEANLALTFGSQLSLVNTLNQKITATKLAELHD